MLEGEVVFYITVTNLLVPQFSSIQKVGLNFFRKHYMQLNFVVVLYKPLMCRCSFLVGLL